ncbi:MAG: methionyl-tRNA formyltransferase [Candidatus Gracilibacteria bacterium]
MAKSLMYIRNMKIYFFGTPGFAIPSLSMLFNSTDFLIQAVVTQPDKPGNRRVLTPPPIKLSALKLGLKVLQPEKIDKELIEKIKKDAPDAIIVIAYGGLIPKEVLEIPKYGCINVHPSLLPKYRGASPIQEALLNGDKETGISIMKVDEKLDHGPVYLVKRIEIEDKDTFETLSGKLAIAAALLLLLALKDIEEGNLPQIPQPDSKATFCRKIAKEDGLIDWERSSKEILNQIRALNPWPSTYTSLQGKTLKILEAVVRPSTKKGKPGSTEILDKNTFGFHTKDSLIVPTLVQLEGKPQVTAKEFLNGYKSSLS